jgi:hypothetical protein
MIQRYRINHQDFTAESNVAVFEYERDGVKIAVATASIANTWEKERKIALFDIFENGEYKRTEPLTEGVSGMHAEELIALKLGKEGLGNLVTRGESEREPCFQQGHYCAMKIDVDFPETEHRGGMQYNAPYGTNPEESGRTNAVLVRLIKEWVAKERPLGWSKPMLFTRPGEAPPTGATVETLSSLGEPKKCFRTCPAPGGIDFSSLELRYLAEPRAGSNTGLRFAFSGRPGTEDDRAEGRTTARQSSDAFFVWLSLAPSKFWVNLNPNEPDRVIDAQLGKTDAGRVLLQADLQLKKTVGQLIHPDSPLGARFWSELYSRAAPNRCNAERTWIVPAPATIREEQGALYILDAPLTVETESSYVESRSGGRAPSCGRQDEAGQQQYDDIYRALILPRLREAVNQAPEYAELRRVYLSRVAAEWYRKRSAQTTTTFADMIDSGDVHAWPARQRWSPREAFDQYVRSYTEHEFTITRQARRGDTIVTRTMFYGGVDLTTVPFHDVDPTQFDSKWRELPAMMNQALQQATTAPDGTIWIGSTAAPDTAASRAVSRHLNWVFLGLLLGGVLFLVIFPGPVIRMAMWNGSSQPRRL